MSLFVALDQLGFEIEFTAHAQAILSTDFPEAVDELERALVEMTIPIEEIVGSGGGESKATQRLRHSLADLNWKKTVFRLEKTINGVPRESTSHEIDHVRRFDHGMIALEIEWNNKDPFFDRDLENMKRLHAEGGINVGVIVTRGSALQAAMKDYVQRFATEHALSQFEDLEKIGLRPTRRQRTEIEKSMQKVRDPLSFGEAWTRQFVSDKFGAATTHWGKLMDRVRRGVGNPCPLLLIGLPSGIVSFGSGASLDTEDEVETQLDPE